MFWWVFFLIQCDWYAYLSMWKEHRCCISGGWPDNRYIYYFVAIFTLTTLQWRYNGHDCVSNHHPHHCLINRFFGRRSKKTSNLRVTDLCVANSPGTGEFPAQMASNAENVSIWGRHHETMWIFHGIYCSIVPLPHQLPHRTWSQVAKTWTALW